jgi:hypothetical protein
MAWLNLDLVNLRARWQVPRLLVKLAEYRVMHL